MPIPVAFGESVRPANISAIACHPILPISHGSISKHLTS